MNNLGIMIAGALCRGAVLAVLGVLAYLIGRRKGPAEGAFAAVTGLSLLTMTAILAPVPWPRWNLAVERRDRSAERPPEQAVADPEPPNEAAQSVNGDRPPIPASNRPSWATSFAETFAEALWTPEPQEAPSWRWPSWVAVAYLAMASALAGRLLLGLWCVRLPTDTIATPSPVELLVRLAENRHD